MVRRALEPPGVSSSTTIVPAMAETAISCEWPAAKLNIPDLPTSIVARLTLESTVYDRAPAASSATVEEPSSNAINAIRNLIRLGLLNLLRRKLGAPSLGPDERSLSSEGRKRSRGGSYRI